MSVRGSMRHGAEFQVAFVDWRQIDQALLSRLTEALQGDSVVDSAIGFRLSEGGTVGMAMYVLVRAKSAEIAKDAVEKALRRIERTDVAVGDATPSNES